MIREPAVSFILGLCIRRKPASSTVLGRQAVSPLGSYYADNAVFSNVKVSDLPSAEYGPRGQKIYMEEM